MVPVTLMLKAMVSVVPVDLLSLAIASAVSTPGMSGTISLSLLGDPFAVPLTASMRVAVCRPHGCPG
jgi:hypothetical protein